MIGTKRIHYIFLCKHKLQRTVFQSVKFFLHLRAFFLFFQIFFDPPGCDPTHCRITQLQEICRSFQSFQMLFQKYGGSLFYSYGLKCSQTELKTFI